MAAAQRSVAAAGAMDVLSVLCYVFSVSLSIEQSAYVIELSLVPSVSPHM